MLLIEGQAESVPAVLEEMESVCGIRVKAATRKLAQCPKTTLTENGLVNLNGIKRLRMMQQQKLKTYLQSGCPDGVKAAWQLFEALVAAGDATVFTYNTMLQSKCSAAAMQVFVQRMRKEGVDRDPVSYKILIKQHLLEGDYGAAADAVEAAEADASACTTATASAPTASAAAAVSEDGSSSGSGKVGGGGGGGGVGSLGLHCQRCGSDKAFFSKQQMKHNNAQNRRCVQCIAEKHRNRATGGQQRQQQHNIRDKSAEHAMNRDAKLERKHKHNNVFDHTARAAQPPLGVAPAPSPAAAAAAAAWASPGTIEELRSLAMPGGTLTKNKLWDMRAKAVWRYMRTAGEEGHTAAWALYDALSTRIPEELKGRYVPEVPRSLPNNDVSDVYLMLPPSTCPNFFARVFFFYIKKR